MKHTESVLCLVLLLGVSGLIGCSDPPLPEDGVATSSADPNTADFGNLSPTNPNRPNADADTGPSTPRTDPDELPCETAEVVPADARGDIEYPVSDASDVILLGLGHDTRRDELLQECVTGMVGQSGAQDAVFEVHEIESRSQLSEDLKVNARIKGGFLGIGFDNRFSLARSREISMYDLNIWVQVRVQTGSEALVRDVVITEENMALLGDDPYEFSRRCGDRFVQQVTYGGELIIILSISTTSESDRRELSNRLSASFGLWGSANVNVEENVSRELEGREFNIFMERSGGGGALPNVSSPEELFAYAQAFPEEVANNDAAIFEFVTRPYDRIADVSACLPGFDKKSIQLMELAWETANEAIGVRNALNDAIENPQDYACGTNQERRASLENVDAFLSDVDDLTAACAQAMLEPSASVFTSPDCRSLTARLSEFVVPEMPLRWQTVMNFTLNPTSRRQSVPISTDLVCPVVDIEGRWRLGTGRNHDWLDCPTGALNSGRYEVEFDDRGGYSDNQGTCGYTFRCMNEQDAYLLDECL